VTHQREWPQQGRRIQKHLLETLEFGQSKRQFGDGLLAAFSTQPGQDVPGRQLVYGSPRFVDMAAQALQVCMGERRRL